jgi:cysteinyl-tRNA synthetase
MKLFNSLSRQLEDFQPLNPKEVTIYICGPTVYSYITIGNWRTYFLGDLLIRTLNFFNYKTKYIMNITDVGHLTGDNLGDADTGEDRLEKAASVEGKTAWDIAKFYTDDFLKDFEKLNLQKPFKFSKATDHIVEQTDLIKKIEAKGFTYKISDGIYFDVAKYEQAGNKYGGLSNLDQIKEGARIEPNPEKKDPRDFALWKFSPKDTKRQMEWESPWGVGFPGWHIECSAMSIKYLGEQIDIHIGGEDLRSTHHPNEIAQSECATGKKPFVKYWLHCAFLQVDGGRMGKSLGNAYTLTDIEKKGFQPEHLRYLYLTGHYRQPLNFTWQNLENAKRTYERLVEHFGRVIPENYPLDESQESGLELSEVAQGFEKQFKQALENDLQTPQALAVIWDMIRSDIADHEKLQLILDWDQVLGLRMSDKLKVKGDKFEYVGEKSNIKIVSDIEIDQETLDLIDEREIARREKNWERADEIRGELREKQINIKDENEKVLISK